MKIQMEVVTVAKYTTTINDIINHYLPEDIRYTDFSLNTLVQKTHKQFFNFEYDFYTTNEELKAKFEQDFLLRYLNEYIGYETLGMFRARLLAHLNTEMYWYKKMYDAITSGDNPFENQNETVVDDFHSERHEQEDKKEQTTNHGKSTNASTSHENDAGTNKNTRNSQSIHSDNPQVTIKSGDYASTMERGTITDSGSTTDRMDRTDNSIGTQDFNGHVGKDNRRDNTDQENRTVQKNGLTGISRADAIAKYADQIFNLEKMLIESCSGFFLKLW